MEEWNTMVESAAYLRCNQLFRIFNSVKIWQENMFIKFLEGKNLTTSAGYESTTPHSQTNTLYKERELSPMFFIFVDRVGKRVAS